MSAERLQRLADKYGKNLRFYPGGNEVLEQAIEDGEKAVRTPEEQSAIDKARAKDQELEQEKANAQRARTALQDTQSKLDEANAEKDTLRQQLAEAEAKAAEAGIEDVDLDEQEYEGTDLNLVKAINALKVKQKTKDAEVAALKKKVSDYETKIRSDAAKQKSLSNYEQLLDELDEEYGAQYRNEAVKSFNELIAKGKVPKGNVAKATRILERCYKEAKSSKKDDSELALDTGTGGGETPGLKGAEIKEGSLDEVASQYANALKGRK